MHIIGHINIISIHAPAKGATVWMLMLRTRDLVFQSTLPRRERRKSVEDRLQTIEISLHAPAKGATEFNARLTFAAHNFNPRSREGSDCAEGRDQKETPDFNPRSREGSDQDNEPWEMWFLISIHAPAKGATS